MIVELFGLPGSGKSTLISEFCEHQENFKHDGTESFIGNNKFYKFSHFRLCLNSKNIIFLIYSILSVIGRKSTIKIKMHDRVISLLYALYIFDLINTSEENIILDEGLVQALSAFYIGIDFKITYLEKIKKLLTVKKYMFCFCDLSMDESLRRIRARNRKTANIDFMEKDELIHFMYELSKNYKIISDGLNKDFNQAVIDMHNGEKALKMLLTSVAGE